MEGNGGYATMDEYCSSDKNVSMIILQVFMSESAKTFLPRNVP
jgi:hypothetical protein